MMMISTLHGCPVIGCRSMLYEAVAALSASARSSCRRCGPNNGSRNARRFLTLKKIAMRITEGAAGEGQAATTGRTAPPEEHAAGAAGRAAAAAASSATEAAPSWLLCVRAPLVMLREGDTVLWSQAPSDCIRSAAAAAAEAEAGGGVDDEASHDPICAAASTSH